MPARVPRELLDSEVDRHPVDRPNSTRTDASGSIAARANHGECRFDEARMVGFNDAYLIWLQRAYGIKGEFDLYASRDAPVP